MTISIHEKGPALSEQDIAAFESRTHLSLPAEFRAFLLANNGGIPEPRHFNVPGWRFKESLVNDFSAIDPSRFDMEEMLSVLEGRLPNGAVPIASDPAGNYILLGTTGTTRGKVYFWDHEQEPFEAPAEIDDFPNVYPLAQGFEQFLAQLWN